MSLRNKVEKIRNQINNRTIVDQTLKVSDFQKFAKEVGFVYITKATCFTENGVKMCWEVGPQKEKLKELRKKWKVK